VKVVKVVRIWVGENKPKSSFTTCFQH